MSDKEATMRKVFMERSSFQSCESLYNCEQSICVDIIMNNLLTLGILSLILLGACNKDSDLDETILQDYLTLNASDERADLVACAGGREIGLMGDTSRPTDVFFYPVKGATDFRYFEAENVADSLDYTQYTAKELDDEPLFNGYLWKFNNLPFTGERMGIVTYKTPGKLHVCSPVRLKTNVKPTELNHDLITVQEDGITPSFSWQDGVITENVIYFQIVSDMDGNLISGTYTTDKQWTFYDESNVVFNVTDTTTVPTLAPNQTYKFSLMGVSEDNWVNLFGEQEFVTQ